MIINTTKVKTEALLLFCRDLIDSYNNSDELVQIPIEIETKINDYIKQLRVAIDKAVQPAEYYLRNQRVSRINMILKSYNFLVKYFTKILKEGDTINPSMLCFTLLSTWFAELQRVINEKEFIYFNIFPYTQIYDMLLLDIKDSSYKALNIKMLKIAEDAVLKLDNYRFR
jgi:hypothetical protein